VRHGPNIKSGHTLYWQWVPLW